MNGIIIAIVALALVTLGLLVFQVYSANHFAAQMKAIDSKLNSIQWPVKQ